MYEGERADTARVADSASDKPHAANTSSSRRPDTSSSSLRPHSDTSRDTSSDTSRDTLVATLVETLVATLEVLIYPFATLKMVTQGSLRPHTLVA